MNNGSSDEIPVEVVKRTTFKEPDWEKLATSVNSILFKKFSGRPISFHFKTDNLTLKRKLENLVVAFGGHRIQDYIDMDNTSALMVVDDSREMLFERPSFKVSFIVDCIQRNTLLDIGEYLHNCFSFKQINHMNIIFWGNGVFQSKTIEPFRDSSDSSDEEFSLKKHTRQMYTRNEKEAILKFLLSQKKCSGIRGDSIWKKMERRGVCPKRTYQSMKNHFLKTLLFELDKYEFLSKQDKIMFKNE